MPGVLTRAVTLQASLYRHFPHQGRYCAWTSPWCSYYEGTTQFSKNHEGTLRIKWYYSQVLKGTYSQDLELLDSFIWRVSDIIRSEFLNAVSAKSPGYIDLRKLRLERMSQLHGCEVEVSQWRGWRGRDRGGTQGRKTEGAWWLHGEWWPKALTGGLGGCGCHTLG